MRRLHRRCVPVVLMTMGSLLAACGGGGGSTTATDGSPIRLRDSLKVAPLQSISGQKYRYTVAGTAITVSAPSTNDPVKLGSELDQGRGVIGEAFWRPTQPARTDQQVCARLDSVEDLSTVSKALAVGRSEGSKHLPGLALRVSARRGGTVAAITITQNPNAAAVYTMAVNGIRSATSGGSASASVSLFGSLNFSDVVGRWTGKLGGPSFATTMKPPPWNMCARVIGTRLSVKMWTGEQAEPLWSDKTHVRSMKIPIGWVYEGFGGGFEQGLSPGKTSVFTGLTVVSPY